MKTHTFRLGKYHISMCSRIDGVTDCPTKKKWKDQYKEILLIDGNDFKAFNAHLHEGLHAEGIPDKYLHDKSGCSDTERLTRFLWRLGYRRVK